MSKELPQPGDVQESAPESRETSMADLNKEVQSLYDYARKYLDYVQGGKVEGETAFKREIDSEKLLVAMVDSISDIKKKIKDKAWRNLQDSLHHCCCKLQGRINRTSKKIYRNA